MTPATLITNHLDTWTSAIKAKSSAGRGGGKKQEFHGIKKLRELILELAVRGLLVPQDPEDEPAAELLRRIASEKARLVKEGENKKQKDLPHLSKDELQFEAPAGWEWTRLQDVTVYIQRGKGPEYADNGSVRVVSQKCIQWTGFDLSAARFVSDDSLGKYQPERFLLSNDLLWNSTGTGTAGRINRINDIPENTLVADSHVTIVRVLNFNSSFINSYISSSGIQNRLLPSHENSLVSGTTNQVELNTSSAINLPLPLPPLAEQHRIVAKVDELMALCDQLELRQEDNTRTHAALVETLLSALTAAKDHGAFTEAWQQIAAHFHPLFTTEASIDQLKQTILQLAVMGKLVEQDPGDEPASQILKNIAIERSNLFKAGKIKKEKPPVSFAGLDELRREIPKEWEWVRLSLIADIVRGGSPRPAGDPRFYDGEIPFLKVGDITNNKGKFVEGFTSTIKEAGLKKTRYIDERTVLLSNSGATLGIPAICEFPTTFNDGIAAFVEKSEFIYDVYLYLCLKNLSAWFLNIASRGQGQPNLNTDIIKAAWIPLPPLAEQHRIVAQVDELMALCDRLKARLQSTKSTQFHLAGALVEAAIH